ncbi:hypothetical protein [Runella aurantiaca]|uniref:hypothetical protein n=1 Tax=Runella aurantiaca TaxID=2282308 RepID=UPI0011C051CE|nr:hypothetical protein [Runella aurantiaca]
MLRFPHHRKAPKRCDAIGVGPAEGRLEDRVSQFSANFAVARAGGLEAAAKLAENHDKNTSQILDLQNIFIILAWKAF